MERGEEEGEQGEPGSPTHFSKKTHFQKQVGRRTWLEQGEEIEQLEEQEEEQEEQEEQEEGDFLWSPEFDDSVAWRSKEPP